MTSYLPSARVGWHFSVLYTGVITSSRHHCQNDFDWVQVKRVQRPFIQETNRRIVYRFHRTISDVHDRFGMLEYPLIEARNNASVVKETRTPNNLVNFHL
jgi:hypothetical protein